MPLARAQVNAHQVLLVCRFLVCRSQINFSAEAPLASAQGFGVSPSGRARCLLVGSNDCAIDIMNPTVDLAFGLGLRLDGLKEALPEAGFAPSIEAAGHGAPGALTFGQIVPGSAGTQPPQPAIEEASMICSGSTRLRFLRRKQQLEPLPLCVGKFFAFHSDECIPLARVCKHALIWRIAYSVKS
jgi:hypothetical protein